jgi:hypothetical protein
MIACRLRSNARRVAVAEPAGDEHLDIPGVVPPSVSVTRFARESEALSICVVPSYRPGAPCGTPPRLRGRTFAVVAPEQAKVSHMTPLAERTFVSRPYRFAPPPAAARERPEAIA